MVHGDRDAGEFALEAPRSKHVVGRSSEAVTALRRYGVTSKENSSPDGSELAFKALRATCNRGSTDRTGKFGLDAASLS